MTTLIASAYGRFSPNANLLDESATEDLYSIFLARSELMRWSSLGSSPTPQLNPPLWSMNEAELTYGADGADDSRIGFAQVGLEAGITERLDASDPERPAQQRTSSAAETAAEDAASDQPQGRWVPSPYPMQRGPPTDSVIAIPPLVQCVDDVLRWFGETEVSAYQLTATNIAPQRRSHWNELLSALNWFNIVGAKSRERTVVTLAADQWDRHMAAQAVAEIQLTNTAAFEIGPLVTVPDAHAARPEWRQIEWTSIDAGVAASIPEWSPATAGWLIAKLFDAALSLDPAPQHLAVRATRTDA